MSKYDHRDTRTLDRDASPGPAGLGAGGAGAAGSESASSTRSSRGPRQTPSSAPRSSPTSRRALAGRGRRARAACGRQAPPPPRRRLGLQRTIRGWQAEPAREHAESLPAWSLPAGAGEQISLGDKWPERVTREWAWGGSTGKGVRVCILDSGDRGRPPARRRGRPARSPSRIGRGRRDRASSRTPRATSAGTARPAPASSARSRPTASSDQRARARRRASRAAAPSCSAACAGRSSRAST